MIRGSIRLRLMAWYLGVLALATATLAGGGWWLLRRSVVGTADQALSSSLAAVDAFIHNSVRASLPPGELQDEFREYSQLTVAASLFEVEEIGGAALYRSGVAGWDGIRAAAPPGAPGALFPPIDVVSQELPYRVMASRVEAAGRSFWVIVALPMGPAQDALARFGWLLGALAPVVLLIAGVGGYWISRRALAPVDRITRAASAITLQNLGQRLPVPDADDELRRLTVTFNLMLSRLQASIADIVRFTAEASHELRTPVSLVRTTAEVALSRDRSAEEYRQALSEVVAQAERMSGLVADLLVLARADAGVEPDARVSIDLAGVAREAARDVARAAERQALQLDVQLPDQAILVEAQSESLRRLVLILLDNAVKYTPTGGQVRLALDRAATGSDGGAVLTISDSGIGIDPDDRLRVFDRFYRGAAARQHAADGSGLGLSIARVIVQRWGGSIQFSAGLDGRGCTATVTLPAARD